MWRGTQAPLELSDFQVGRLMGLLYNQQTATKEFAMSISCMEDMLEDRVGSLQRDRGGYDPQDLHLQDACKKIMHSAQSEGSFQRTPLTLTCTHILQLIPLPISDRTVL